MHNGQGLMQSESNYVKIILFYNIFCITRMFFVSFLKQWQKPTVSQENSPERNPMCNALTPQILPVAAPPALHVQPGQESTAEQREEASGWSNFFPMLETRQSAGTDSTMGPLKAGSDNGRGGDTTQLKTKADSSQNSLPEALQQREKQEGKNKFNSDPQ